MSKNFNIARAAAENYLTKQGGRVFSFEECVIRWVSSASKHKATLLSILYDDEKGTLTVSHNGNPLSNRDMFNLAYGVSESEHDSGALPMSSMYTCFASSVTVQTRYGNQGVQAAFTHSSTNVDDLEKEFMKNLDSIQICDVDAPCVAFVYDVKISGAYIRKYLCKLQEALPIILTALDLTLSTVNVMIVDGPNVTVTKKGEDVRSFTINGEHNHTVMFADGALKVAYYKLGSDAHIVPLCYKYTQSGDLLPCNRFPNLCIPIIWDARENNHTCDPMDLILASPFMCNELAYTALSEKPGHIVENFAKQYAEKHKLIPIFVAKEYVKPLQNMLIKYALPLFITSNDGVTSDKDDIAVLRQEIKKIDSKYLDEFYNEYGEMLKELGIYRNAEKAKPELKAYTNAIEAVHNQLIQEFGTLNARPLRNYILNHIERSKNFDKLCARLLKAFNIEQLTASISEFVDSDSENDLPIPIDDWTYRLLDMWIAQHTIVDDCVDRQNYVLVRDYLAGKGYCFDTSTSRAQHPSNGRLYLLQVGSRVFIAIRSNNVDLYVVCDHMAGRPYNVSFKDRAVQWYNKFYRDLTVIYRENYGEEVTVKEDFYNEVSEVCLTFK